MRSLSRCSAPAVRLSGAIASEPGATSPAPPPCPLPVGVPGPPGSGAMGWVDAGCCPLTGTGAALPNPPLAGVNQALCSSPRPAASLLRWGGCQPFIRCFISLSLLLGQGRVLGGSIWVSGFRKCFLEIARHVFSVWCLPSPAPSFLHHPSSGGCSGVSGSPRAPGERVGRGLQETDRAGMFVVSSCFLLHKAEYFIWLRASSLNLKIAGFLPGGVEQFAFSRFIMQISHSPHTQ